MKLKIPQDELLHPVPPRLFLCTTGKKRMQELPAYETSLNAKWNSWSELNFSFDRFYVDINTGETKVHPAFDKAEGLRLVLAENMGYFIIQDPETNYSDKDSKTISAFSLEYTLGSRYLENWYINTGEVDSKEVIYLSGIYGEDYGINDDERYKLASGEFDAYGSYYIKEYKDSQSYTYEQVEISNATVYATYDGSTVEKTLYVKKFDNVRFYYPTKPQLSLLHLILEYMPGWTIGNVDVGLWRKERKFSEERISIYDFLTNNMAETFKCVVVFNTLEQTISCYEESDDGLTEDGVVKDAFETDIYISRDNLANEINIKYSTDDIKTKLKVSGADDLDIREVNVGQNYIMNLDYYHNEEWMEQDVLEAYDDYLLALNGDINGATEDLRKGYSKLYTETKQSWVAAYNRWNDLMNAVPAEGNVVLIGDEFKKLYCINSVYKHVNEYSQETTKPIYYVMNEDGSYNIATPQPISQLDIEHGSFYVAGDEDSVVAALVKQLNLYHVDDDIKANQNDNILLRLKNSNDDIATIRIYDPKQQANGTQFNPNVGYYTKIDDDKYQIDRSVTAETYNTNNALYMNNYKIQIVIVRASSGMAEAPFTRELSSWVNGNLRTSNQTANVGLSILEGFKITYIGTMGAYLVLAKDEKDPENLQDYGVQLLREKRDTYTKLFQTQIEAMFSQEKYQCIVMDEQPEGNYASGTRWLDSDSSPLKLYEYYNPNGSNGEWRVISGEVSEEDRKDYENYQRYLDNFDKLKTVQEVLLKKEKEAEYCRNGYEVSGRNIDIGTYQHGIGASLEGDMQRAAQEHFNEESITRVNMDNTLPLYTFTTSAYPNEIFAVYLNGKTPYVSYANSQGVYQVKMNYYRDQAELRRFFNDEQWLQLSPLIREDEFNDGNFLLTGYESEEERLSIGYELVKEASKKLKTLSQPSLEFSMNMGNILALPEFTPITNQFELGNFIRIELRPGLVKKARLLEVQLNFDDLSDFSCTFGNLVTSKSEIDLHAELLKQAMTAGKQVATSASSWQRAVDKSNKLEQAINEGLQGVTLELGKANGQSITIGPNGLYGKKLIDGTTDKYEDEQVALINNKLVFTGDNWKTSKSAFGKYTVNGEERWGVLSDYVTAQVLEGKTLIGCSLRVGNEGGQQFVVNEDGSVEITDSYGNNKYASKEDVDIVKDARRFHVEIVYNGQTVFSEPNSSCELRAVIYSWDTDITDDVMSKGARFSWIRNSRVDDSVWNAAHTNQTSNTIIIGNSDIEHNASFEVSVVFDDTNL